MAGSPKFPRPVSLGLWSWKTPVPGPVTWLVEPARVREQSPDPPTQGLGFTVWLTFVMLSPLVLSYCSFFGLFSLSSPQDAQGFCPLVVRAAHALETDGVHGLDQLGFLLLENRTNSTNLAGLFQGVRGILWDDGSEGNNARLGPWVMLNDSEFTLSLVVRGKVA